MLKQMPPGRLERPRMVPETTALSTELWGHALNIIPQRQPSGKLFVEARQESVLNVAVFSAGWASNPLAMTLTNWLPPENLPQQGLSLFSQ